MTVTAVCNKCGAVYDDEASIDLAKKWIRAGYAPCPNLACPGELELKEVASVGKHSREESQESTD